MKSSSRKNTRAPRAMAGLSIRAAAKMMAHAASPSVITAIRRNPIRWLAGSAQGEAGTRADRSLRRRSERSSKISHA